MIALVRDVLHRLGFERPSLRLSHTGIIRSILATADIRQEQVSLYDRLMKAIKPSGRSWRPAFPRRVRL